MLLRAACISGSEGGMCTRVFLQSDGPGLRAYLASPECQECTSVLQLFLRRLLRWHSIWLTEDSRRLDTLQMQWIYSLAAAMDEVFPMGTAATLRDMLRHCAKLSIEPRDETELINIHIVIAVAGVYFKQGEQLAAPLQ